MECFTSLLFIQLKFRAIHVKGMVRQTPDRMSLLYLLEVSQSAVESSDQALRAAVEALAAAQMANYQAKDVLKAVSEAFVHEDKNITALSGQALRGTLEEGSNKVQGGVCYLERPDVFYVCPTDMVEIFPTILEKSQEEVPGTVNPVLGSCVLALDEETCWYRAEITSLSSDKMTATLFLIDYGKEVTTEVVNLRPLPTELHKYPGLVVKVKLRGIKPANGEAWTDVDRDAAALVLDVGGQTLFEFQNVKKEEGEVTLDLMDTDGNDVADFMIQTGCALPINEDLSGNLNV